MGSIRKVGNFISKRSAVRRARQWRGRIVLFLAFFLVGGCALPMHGQGCAAVWGNASYVYGVVVLSGNGSGTYAGDLKETISQNAQVNGALQPSFPGSCSFMVFPGTNIGVMKSTSNVNDTWTNTDNGNFMQWTSSGPGDYSGANMSFAFTDLAGDQYGFGAFDATMGKLTTNSGTTNEDIIWGPASSDGGATQSQLPVTAGAPVVWGVSKFSSPAFNNAQGGGLVSVPWEEDWLFAAGPDKDCEECKKHDAPAKGSEISPRSQILGEEVDLVGTPFFLHYASSRVPGYAGADLFALKDALSLGGWTLSVHHVFEPLLQSYCAGGGCTPYAIVPKAIFFGDGNTRSDADVQASVPLNGNYLITDEDGTEVYVFNGNGLHLKTLAPMTGAVIYTFAYDANNRLVSVTDANGNVTSIQRDANGHPISITSPYGQKTTLAVDANGFLSTITDPAGHATKLASSATGLLQSLTDPRGKVYSYTYDGLGMLTKHVDPAGGSITLARTSNAAGYSVTNTTGAGRVSTYGVTFGSNSTQTSQATTNTWPNGLKATESLIQRTGQLSRSVSVPTGSSFTDTIGADPRWGIQLPIRTTENITRGNLTMGVSGTRTANFTAGNPFSLVSQTDSQTINGRTYSSVFTTANRTYMSKSPVGRIRTITLDAQERLSTAQLTGMALNKFTYDSRGRLSTFSEGPRKYTFTYLTSGFLGSVTDALLQKTTFTYSPAGLLLSATLPDGRAIHETVDVDGNMTSITPANGFKHSFTFSAVNMPVSYVPPSVTGAGTTAYAFNGDKDMTKITRADGQVITYAYDTAGRLKTLTAPSEKVSFTYNATTGNLSGAMVSGGEAIAYGYNGSLRTSSSWTGTVAGTVARSFDNNFWLASQSVIGAATVLYTHDKDGFVTKAGLLAMRRAGNTGLVTGTTLASTTDASIHNTFAELTSYTGKYQTNTLYSAVYTRDNLGRVVTNTETIGGTTTIYGYTYDKAGRLTGVTTNGTATSAYAYDNNSNRIAATTSAGSITAEYDAQDRLTHYANAAYSYSADGELTSATVGSQITSYQYDVMGNLLSVTLPNGKQISYIVDGENNRVGKKVNGILTQGFLYDGADVVAQLNASNQVVNRFVYSGISSAPDYMIKGGVQYRIFSDHLGSPRLVVNAATGQLVERIDYDEFGNVISDSNPGFQPFGFAGGLYDQDTKLVRFGARDYDASTGRWTTKDPVLFGGGDFNLYTYSANDPINRTDLSGNDASDVGMAVLDAYMIASGQGAVFSFGKMICKGALQAQDDGLTKATKDAAYKKATKNMNAREEYATGVKEATKSAPDVAKEGNAGQRAVNGINGGLSGSNTGPKPAPCPNCKPKPAAFVPDPKANQNLKEHMFDAQKKADQQNLY